MNFPAADICANAVAVYLIRPTPDVTAKGDSKIIGASSGVRIEFSALKQSFERQGARVISADPGTGHIEVSYPAVMFEPGNVAQWLSVFAKGPLAHRSQGLRLFDLSLPSALTRDFKGPKFGLEGIRRMIGTAVTKRPHLGAAMALSVGSTADDIARAAYELGIGGIDFCRDNDVLTDQSSCRMSSRVVSVMEALDKVREETGRRVLYAVNITSDVDEIIDRADTAIEHGANCVMIDALALGLSCIRMLSEDASIALPIHVHGTAQVAFTLDTSYATTNPALGKLTRLLGGDQLQIDAARMGKAPAGELRAYRDVLLGQWNGYRGVIPTFEGAIHLRSVRSMIETMGGDVAIVADDALSRCPEGGLWKALRQAMDAAKDGVPLDTYAVDHEELRIALERQSR
jgi:ribulose-bisphosphate carboxylase large chain